MQRLAALGVSQLRLWSSLPLNSATAKVLWLYSVGGQEVNLGCLNTATRG